MATRLLMTAVLMLATLATAAENAADQLDRLNKDLTAFIEQPNTADRSLAETLLLVSVKMHGDLVTIFSLFDCAQAMKSKEDQATIVEKAWPLFEDFRKRCRGLDDLLRPMAQRASSAYFVSLVNRARDIFHTTTVLLDETDKAFGVPARSSSP